MLALTASAATGEVRHAVPKHLYVTYVRTHSVLQGWVGRWVVLLFPRLALADRNYCRVIPCSAACAACAGCAASS